MTADDEVVIAGDTHDGPLHETQAILRAFPFKTVFVPHDAGHHDWGHSQLNFTMPYARGDYILFNDDDDVFTPTAMDAVRKVADSLPEPRVLIFRFMTHFRQVTWTDYTLREGTIGGHNLVIPTVPERFGVWNEHYAGDHSFVLETVTKWRKAGVEPVWRTEILQYARPTEAEWQRMQQQIAQLAVR